MLISALLVVPFLVASSIQFVWPMSDRVRPVGAILELNGPSGQETTSKALALAEHGVAPVVLLSVYVGEYRSCPTRQNVTIVCFVPKPARTVGELDFAESYAHAHGITSLLVVAGHAQTTRARLLAQRCFHGRSYVVAAPMPWRMVPYAVVYEWGALVKATVIDRGCS